MKSFIAFLLALIMISSRVYASACNSCNICYRCTYEDSQGCCVGSCVYDEAYCYNETECLDCAADEICEMWTGVGCCASCAPNTEIEECLETSYRDPISNTCVPCPSDPDCEAYSNGYDGVGSCYLGARICQKQNTKGKYEFSSDCFYTDPDSGADTDISTEEDEAV